MVDARELAASLAAKHNTRNPFRIAEGMGYIVVLAPLVEMRGFQQRAMRRNIIYINQDLDEQQRCLVCAHEMAHHLLHGGLNRVYMDKGTKFVAQKFENEAHLFSLELIYSDEELAPFLSCTIENAAAYMGVPISLASRRMNTVQSIIWAQDEGDAS